jgi:hypothetical protein
MNVEEEVERLREEIKRLGKLQDDASYKVYANTLSFLAFLHFISNTLVLLLLLFFFFLFLSNIRIRPRSKYIYIYIYRLTLINYMVFEFLITDVILIWI